MFKFRAWKKDQETGALTVEYKATALAAKRAYLAFSRDDTVNECGWETRGHWDGDRGDAGVLWEDVPAALSPAQSKLLASARSLALVSDHGLLVSGHQYRTALALERAGLGRVRYQGPSLGWFSLTA